MHESRRKLFVRENDVFEKCLVGRQTVSYMKGPREEMPGCLAMHYTKVMLFIP